MGKQHTLRKIKVLHVSPEMTPLSKVGGLADVAFSLPEELIKCDVDARVLTCAYPSVLDKAKDLGSKPVFTRRIVHVALNWKVYSGKIWKTIIRGLPVYILDNLELFTNERIYPNYLDQESALPFFFLSYAALEVGTALNWHPDIIHSHDWGTSPLASAVKWHPFYSNYSRPIKTVLTIHNLAHQGILDPSVLNMTGLMEGFHIDGLEYYGLVNLLKGSINSSDRITTVSPTYAREISEPGRGMGLDGLIRANSHKLVGILNGIDTEYWDPSRDNFLPAPYSISNFEGKKQARGKMLEFFRWEDDGSPIFCNIGRLYDQKGLDILIPSLPELVGSGAKFVFLGSGEKYYEEELRELSESYPGSVGVITGFNEPLAHLIYAGADFFLMPSLFEPCGLSQLISMRYGTIPVARRTGGIADTVSDEDTGRTGFLFDGYSREELVGAVKRALECYSFNESHKTVMKNAMKKDFSWKTSAGKYHRLYRELASFDHKQDIK
jgi:starch synthase